MRESRTEYHVDDRIGRPPGRPAEEILAYRYLHMHIWPARPFRQPAAQETLDGRSGFTIEKL